jgi:antitoxin CptB
MDRTQRLRRCKFRAWHRGTREADFLVGGFFDSRHESWNEADIAWFEALLDEQDVDILAWAMGAAEPDRRFSGVLMEALQRLDYVIMPR